MVRPVYPPPSGGFGGEGPGPSGGITYPSSPGSPYGNPSAPPSTNPSQPPAAPPPNPSPQTAAPPMNVLSMAANADRQKLASGDQWIVLLSILWNGEYLRLARNTEPVQFDCGDGFGVQTYQPFAFDLECHTPSGAQLPTVRLAASNVNRLLQGLVEQYKGVVGATANLYVLNTAFPGGEPDLSMEMQIISTHCNAQTVTFSLGAANPTRQLFPRYLYRANFCMWKYKGTQCGYTGNLATCDLTLDGQNGCQVHNNSPRFGAFRGIGTNGAAIASQM